MSIVLKQGGQKTVIPIWSSEIGLVDINNKFEGKKNVEDALQLLKSNMDQLSNPNILINGDFRNPINQRGQAVYNTNGYSIDRWILWNANTTLTVNEGYCTLAGDYNNLVQHIEFPTLYSNKEITLSAKVRGSGGGIKITIFSLELNRMLASKVIDATAWKEISVSCMIDTLTNDSKRLSVSIEGAGANIIDIEWVKLELGSVATPFVPRSYGEELALCQRYYLPINPTQRCRSIMVNNNVIMCELPIPTTMRINPTLVKNPNVDDNRNIEVARLDGTLETGFAITYDLVANAIRVKATKNAHGLTDATINFNNKGFDSEIY